MATRRVLLLGGGIAIGFLLKALRKLLKNRDEYDGFGDIVAYSSRRIAASRAMESEEEDPLINDPLAAALAGPRALKAARSRQRAAPPGSGRKMKINMMAIRTKWFDDQLEASLGMSVRSGTMGPVAYVAATCEPGRYPKQVVLLGAGMDSRAWRMRLPADLKWFEVDFQNVLEAKQMLLAAAGAEIEPTSPSQRMRRDESFNTVLEHKIGSLDHHSAGVKYPLRAATWVAVSADLGHPGWTKGLLSVGFDASKPTVWVAEGLLMYLTPDRVSAVLQETAQLSPRGSAFLMLSVTEDVLENIKTKRSSSDLMASWKFGCPDDPQHWLRSNGWEAQLVTTRRSVATSLGLTPDLCGFTTASDTPAKIGRSLFIAATPVST